MHSKITTTTTTTTTLLLPVLGILIFWIIVIFCNNSICLYAQTYVWGNVKFGAEVL